MTVRAVFVPGTWQLVSVVSALSQEHTRAEGAASDILVLFGSGLRAEFRESLAHLAGAVWSWKSVIWADDLMIAHFPTRKFAPLFKEVLHERIGVDIDEVWVAKPYTDPAKLAMNAYPESAVVVYEDGAEEFLEQPVTCGWSRWRTLPITRWPGAVLREWSHLVGASQCLPLLGICARQRKRFRAFYSFLDAYFERPSQWQGVPVRPIEAGAMRAVLADLKKVQEAEATAWPAINDPGAILFLPQPFTAPGSLTAEDEWALYATAVQRIVERGWRIIWKEHPRETKPLGDRIQQAFGADHVTLLAPIKGMPVEALVDGWRVKAVVSVISTALLYLQGLYGFPAYSLAGAIPNERWRQEVDRRLALLFAAQVPSVEVLLANDRDG